MAAMDHPNGSATTASVKPTRHIDFARTTAYEMAVGNVLNKTTMALIELGVFDALARAGKKQLTVQEIVESAMPNKVVNTVDQNGTAPAQRLYELSPVGKFFAKNEDDEDVGSFAWTVQFCESLALHAFTDARRPLPSFVLEEKSSSSSTSHPMFSELFVQNPALGKLFDQVNHANSKDNNPRILESYHGFEGVSVLVDVGGGYGASLKAIIARYPHIKGINFDLPLVIAECPALPGVEHVSGDMLKSIPSGGDAIFMKWILHNFDDECNLKVLKNCWAALPTGGKVIVVEMVLPDVVDPDNCDRTMFLFDIITMQNSGSRERTEKEFRELGLAAGFAHVNVVCQMHSVGTIFEMLKA
ncbi:hypothetical protein M758_7G115700 [Ceratodon purpureus]|nr:hypothetical protein M758_7G115700 [Ceratodon purpureus]